MPTRFLRRAPLVLTMVACKVVDAPDAGRIEIRVPTTLAPADTATVFATVRHETGDLAGARWKVSFTASAGGLGPDRLPVVATTSAAPGSASVLFRAPATEGWVRIGVEFGSARALDSIRIAKPPEP